MRLGPLALLLGAAACATGPRPRPEAAGEGPIVGVVGDVAVVAMEPEGFDALSREERLLAWHLSQAAMASHPIVLMQNYRHDLAIWRLVDALHARRGALDPVFAVSLADYRRRLFLHKGVHDALTEEKFVPDFGRAELEAELARAVAAGFALPPGTDLVVLAPAMFDPAVDRFRVAKTPGPAGDPLKASSVNHYEPGLGVRDLQGFQDRYPLNSRVVRDGGRLAEQPYRAGGDGEPPGLGASGSSRRPSPGSRRRCRTRRRRSARRSRSSPRSCAPAMPPSSTPTTPCGSSTPSRWTTSSASSSSTPIRAR